MKKKILLAAAIVICFAMAASGTLAYFSTTAKATNVITSGGIGIEIREWTIVDGEVAEFPKEGLEGVMPGTSASKVVKIENTGPNEAWIRVKVESSIKDANNRPLASTLENGTPVIHFDILRDWIDGGDGYYYYSKPVAPGDFTTELLKADTFAPQLGNEYQNCKANLVVYAQAVQTANNGSTVQDAKGWPEA